MKASKPSINHLMYAVFIVIAGFLLWRTMQLSNQISQNRASYKEDLAVQNRLIKVSLDYNLALEKVVVDPVSGVVYLPEFRVKLPYNAVTKSIAYSMRNDSGAGGMGQTDPPEADIVSTRYNVPEEGTVLNCSNFVRLKIEDTAKAYNPHEKSASIKLADGRSLQVYELVNVKECQASWENSIAPAAIASEFKKAQSY